MILFATISSLIAQSSPWKGTITTEGGVTVVKNPKEPIHKEPILSLKEDFAISGAGDERLREILFQSMNKLDYGKRYISEYHAALRIELDLPDKPRPAN